MSFFCIANIYLITVHLNGRCRRRILQAQSYYNLNFHPRYRDPQLEVSEMYWYLFNLRQNIYRS